MTKLHIQAPWTIYVSEMTKLFEKDPEVEVEYVAEDKELKLYVESQEKAEALEKLLPAEESFGNVSIKITVIPANKLGDEKEDLFSRAFKGNGAVAYIDEINAKGFHAKYIVFKPEVVQFFNDDLSDIHGIESTLYENIAADIFKDRTGIFFCTDVVNQTFLGRPLGEWP